MKKLILCFIFIPLICYSQDIRFKHKTVISMNTELINNLIAKQDLIKSFNGQTKVYIPYEKTFLPNVATTYVDNQLVQYEWTFKGKYQITEFRPKTKYYIFDFTQKKDNKVIEDNKLYDTDNLDIFKPKEIKKKLEQLKPHKEIIP